MAECHCRTVGITDHGCQQRSQQARQPSRAVVVSSVSTYAASCREHRLCQQAAQCSSVIFARLAGCTQGDPGFVGELAMHCPSLRLSASVPNLHKLPRTITDCKASYKNAGLWLTVFTKHISGPSQAQQATLATIQHALVTQLTTM